MNKHREPKQPIACAAIAIAIAIAKHTLQIQSDYSCSILAGDSSGFEKLIHYLKTLHYPLAVFEAAWDYERSLLEAQRKAEQPFAMVNPARVCDLARTPSIRAKTARPQDPSH